MKKVLIPFIILMCALCCAVAVSACHTDSEVSSQKPDVNGGETAHTHEYTCSLAEPTCTAGGYNVYVCDCGESYTVDIEELPALGHAETEHEGVAATCTERGYKDYVTCSRCDYTTYETIKPLGHAETEHRGVAATCTEGGYKDYVTCSRCDYSTYEIIEPLGHAETEHRGVAATCTEGGYKDYVTCSRCDYTTYEIIEPLGHDNEEYPARKATCTQTGWNSFEKCLRCAYSSFEEIPMLEHSPEWVRRGSFCANECTVCGLVVETALHTFAADGTCALCGLTRAVYLDYFNGSYGYEYLGTEPNGRALQALYSDIDAEVCALHVNGEDVGGDYCFAEINFSRYGLETDDAIKVWKTFRDDNPLYYWFSGKLVYTVESLNLLVYEEYADGEVRNALNEEIYAAAGELCKAVEEEDSAYMKALAFHDAIIEAIDYAYDGNVPQSASWAHSVLGVLQGTGAVCEGYAKTYQLLLNVCGVENIYVTGESLGERHAWNLVRLDNGNWYWCDVTWDDTPEYYWGISYDFFCVADENFLEEHTPESSSGTGINFLYGLPERAQSDYSGEEVNFKTIFTVDGLEYTVIGYNRVSLSGIEKGGKIVIPEQVNYEGRAYAVIAIGKYNVSNDFVSSYIDRRVVSVYVPANIRFIAYNTFYAVAALEEINVDENNAYYSSVQGVLFTKSRDILFCFPNAYKSAEYAIPEFTTKIGYHAFGTGIMEGRILESLTIHAGVNLVGVVNFGGGYGNIIRGEWGNIVNSLTGKKQLNIDERNGSYKVKDGLIFNYNYTYLYASMPNTQNVVIPDTVLSIDSNAFRSNHWIKSIRLPEGWTEIQDHQFTYCYELESIYIPESVTFIGYGAFFGCEKLKSIDLPESLNVIEDYAFYDCALINVIIPDGVTSIGDRAFSHCQNLLSVTLGAGLTEIGEKAFEDCNKLIEVYNFSALEITAGSTENGCAGLYALNVFNNVQGKSGFTVNEEGLIFFTHDGKNFLVGYVGSETRLVLPESFNGGNYDIYGYAFFRSGITEVVIPSCVRVIGEHAFYDSELKTVNIEEGVTIVGTAAFMWCEELNSVIIPASVRLIEEYAFCRCGAVDVYYADSRAEWEKIIVGGAFWETDETVHFGK